MTFRCYPPKWAISIASGCLLISAAQLAAAAPRLAVNSQLSAGESGRDGQQSAGSSAPAQTLKEQRLANGLRYLVVNPASAEAGMAFFIRVKGGFIAERRPGEQGLAHLLEHLIFASPTKSAPDELRRFRQIAMPHSLPEPAAGITSWRDSDYFIVARTADVADLKVLLGLFREVLSELVFHPDAISREKDAVLREMADKQLGNDIHADFIAALAPGSPNDVIDGQNSKDVPNASAETLQTLYNRMYRPENTTIVIVGNVDTAEVGSAIETAFSDWQGVGPVETAIQPPQFRAADIRPVSYSNTPYGRNAVFLSTTMATPQVPETARGQVEALLLDGLALRIINDRLMAGRPNYERGDTGFFIENGEQGHRLLLLWDEFVPGRWAEAVMVLQRTACDLQVNGFMRDEVEAAKQGVLADIETREAGGATIGNYALARSLADSLSAGFDPMLSSDADEIVRELLPTINEQSLSLWWREQRRSGSNHLRVESRDILESASTIAEIRQVANDAIDYQICKVG